MYAKQDDHVRCTNPSRFEWETTRDGTTILVTMGDQAILKVVVSTDKPLFLIWLQNMQSELATLINLSLAISSPGAGSGFSCSLCDDVIKKLPQKCWPTCGRPLPNCETNNLDALLLNTKIMS